MTSLRQPSGQFHLKSPLNAWQTCSWIERAIGYTWFSTDAVHSEVYRLWSDFRGHAIDGIGGMTVNERLHWFGLLQRFDEAETEGARKKIYAKLHART